MRTVLITGAAGFIGSHLVDACLQRGELVLGIDDLSTGRLENIRHALPKMQFHEMSLLDRSALTKACQGVDVIFHQAALPSVPRSIRDPRTSHAANLEGTFELLEAARAAGVKRVIYAASSSAYGNQPGFPRRETIAPAPISPYAVQKLAGELYMQSYARVFGMETVALRYFNIFGPRQDPDSPYAGVVAKFITQLMRSETPTIFGSGEQQRDFTYIQNAVNANLLASEAPGDAVAGKVFNIACGRQISLNEAYDLIANAVGSSIRPRYVEQRAGDVERSLADITAAASALQYVPHVSFAEGIEKTVQWYAAASSNAHSS